MSPQAEAAIDIEGVGKCYTKLEEQAMLLRSVLPMRRISREDFWALQDIDLTVDRGETLGILGRNGAGKTTLLRLLAGVTRPTRGRVTVRGRTAPLISVGVGFHREMSGRENVYINGMLLGLSRAEVDALFDAIVTFAELEDFIDTPVKFYSSGMFMRLGFAVAIHVDPDVLLVDEILAVGDLAFQLKCFERMREVQDKGTTIVCVSHNMHVVRLLCNRAVVLRDGRLEFDGDAGEAIVLHHQLLRAASGTEIHGHTEAPRAAVHSVDRELVGEDGVTVHPHLEELVTYRATVQFEEPVDGPQFVFRVMTQTGVLAYELRTLAGAWRHFKAGEKVEVEVPFQVRLGGDVYSLVLLVTDRDGTNVLFEDQEGLLVYVAPQPGTLGTVDLDATIRVDGHALSDYPEVFLTSRGSLSSARSSATKTASADP